MTSWTAACQAPLSSSVSQSLLMFTSIESGILLTISSSAVSFSFCLHSFPTWGSFPMSRIFASGGQSIRNSILASVLPVNIQGWFPLGLTDLISLLPKWLSRVFSSTTIQKHQFFSAQPSYGPTFPSVHDYWENHSWLYGPLSAKWCLCFLICCLGLS